jgi:hypothetical protein
MSPRNAYRAWIRRCAVLTALSLAGIVGEVRAAAAQVSQNERIDVTFTTFSCSSDPILVEGVTHIQNRAVDSVGGLTHFGGHSSFIGTGVDATGTRYRFVTLHNSQLSYDFNDSPPIILSDSLHGVVIRRGKSGAADDARFVESYHYTINANGELATSKDRLQDDCG